MTINNSKSSARSLKVPQIPIFGHKYTSSTGGTRKPGGAPQSHKPALRVDSWWPAFACPRDTPCPPARINPYTRSGRPDRPSDCEAAGARVPPTGDGRGWRGPCAWRDVSVAPVPELTCRIAPSWKRDPRLPGSIYHKELILHAIRVTGWRAGRTARGLARRTTAESAAEIRDHENIPRARYEPYMCTNSTLNAC